MSKGSCTGDITHSIGTVPGQFNVLTVGKGTPAPWAPPQILVVRGPLLHEERTGIPPIWVNSSSKT